MVNHVNVAGTTVAVRVLSSGTQAVNQARPNFTHSLRLFHVAMSAPLLAP